VANHGIAPRKSTLIRVGQKQAYFQIKLAYDL